MTINLGRLLDSAIYFREENIGDIKAKLEEAQAKLRKASAKKTECQVGMNNSQRKIDQAQQKLENIEAELLKVRERRKQNLELYNELTERGNTLKDDIDAITVSDLPCGRKNPFMGRLSFNSTAEPPKFSEHAARKSPKKERQIQ